MELQLLTQTSRSSLISKSAVMYILWSTYLGVCTCTQCFLSIDRWQPHLVTTQGCSHPIHEANGWHDALESTTGPPQYTHSRPVSEWCRFKTGWTHAMWISELLHMAVADPMEIMSFDNKRDISSSLLMITHEWCGLVPLWARQKLYRGLGIYHATGECH
jgi:hypothetical protein